jgi:hypothetical protein
MKEYRDEEARVRQVFLAALQLVMCEILKSRCVCFCVHVLCVALMIWRYVLRVPRQRQTHRLGPLADW